MSVRKRAWTTRSGEARESWIVDYTDAKGVRRLKTFPRKREADTFEATAKVEIGQGVHVADSASVTVATAGALWLESAASAGLERSTVNQYRQHLTLHIVPFIGALKVSALTIPTVRAFEDKLRTEGRSAAMVRKVLVSVGSLIADAQERGLATRNPIRDMKARRGGKERRSERRHKGKLRVGVHIPRPDEVRALVGALEGRWRPVLLTAVFTGLRSSELRGLRWSDLDLERRELAVRQRADRFNAIGSPKSESGERSVPIPPLVVNTLREWRLACPKGELDLVFPNCAGAVESHRAIRGRGLIPALVRAGVTTEAGQAKYTGLHALRHFYASWCLNRIADGGLGLPLKSVQERMGHSSIVMTADVYGHLFPSDDTGEEMAAAERALLA